MPPTQQRIRRTMLHRALVQHATPLREQWHRQQLLHTCILQGCIEGRRCPQLHQQRLATGLRGLGLAGGRLPTTPSAAPAAGPATAPAAAAAARVAPAPAAPAAPATPHLVLALLCEGAGRAGGACAAVGKRNPTCVLLSGLMAAFPTSDPPSKSLQALPEVRGSAAWSTQG